MWLSGEVPMGSIPETKTQTNKQIKTKHQQLGVREQVRVKCGQRFLGRGELSSSYHHPGVGGLSRGREDSTWTFQVLNSLQKII